MANSGSWYGMKFSWTDGALLQHARTGQSHHLSLLSTSQHDLFLQTNLHLPTLYLYCFFFEFTCRSLLQPLYITLAIPSQDTYFLYHYLLLREPAPAPFSVSFNNNPVRPFNHFAPRLALIGLDVPYPGFIRQPLRKLPHHLVALRPLPVKGSSSKTTRAASGQDLRHRNKISSI